MGFKTNEDGGIQGLFGHLLQSLGQRTAQIGDIIQINAGQCLLAPPPGSLWYSPSGLKGFYELHDLIRRPILEVGDVFGIHPEDPIPLPPSGTQLKLLDNPRAPRGMTAAVVYKVVWPPELAASMALPKPKLPTLQGQAANELPRPEPGRRWVPLYVDGRNLNNVVGAMVAA